MKSLKTKLTLAMAVLALSTVAFAGQGSYAADVAPKEVSGPVSDQGRDYRIALENANGEKDGGRDYRIALDNANKDDNRDGKFERKHHKHSEKWEKDHRHMKDGEHMKKHHKKHKKDCVEGKEKRDDQHHREDHKRPPMMRGDEK